MLTRVLLLMTTQMALLTWLFVITPTPLTAPIFPAGAPHAEVGSVATTT